jgi:Fe-S-cluster-containing dehydrogenase component
MSNNKRYALWINYGYCTGCHTCEIACKKELDLPYGQWGIHILQDGPRKLANGKWDYNYIPTPTSLCDLCAKRVAEGRKPSCVHHCQAGVMAFGTVEELALKLAETPQSAIFAPL